MLPLDLCEDSSDHFNSQFSQNAFRAKCTCDPSDSSYWASSTPTISIKHLSFHTFVDVFVLWWTTLALLFTSTVCQHPTRCLTYPSRQTFQNLLPINTPAPVTTTQTLLSFCPSGSFSPCSWGRTQQSLLRQPSKSPTPTGFRYPHPRTSCYTLCRIDRTPIWNHPEHEWDSQWKPPIFSSSTTVVLRRHSYKSAGRPWPHPQHWYQRSRAHSQCCWPPWSPPHFREVSKHRTFCISFCSSPLSVSVVLQNAA